jgi:hypothetical protein
MNKYRRLYSMARDTEINLLNNGAPVFFLDAYIVAEEF